MTDKEFDQFLSTLSSATDFPALMGQAPSYFPAMAQDSSSAGVRSGVFSPRPQHSVSPGGLQDLLKGNEKCSENRRTCMTSALKIVQTLHVPPSACLSLVGGTSTSSASRQPRKIDSVLSTGRDIVQLMTEMLKCSCLSSSQIQLVMSSICGKLIAWYRAMIRNSPENDRDGSGPDANERVLHQPFKVGEYSVDTRLETKMRAEVVCSELKQLETFVASFLSRIQGNGAPGSSGGKRNQSSSTGSPGLSSGVHARLSAFLYKQLRDAKAESTAIATGGV
ncbi:hypothetical protein MMC07_001631 [Pseudocyphellaria aurata]|nr:hypothetical protein [Pseudocyphellaria aurata]